MIHIGVCDNDLIFASKIETMLLDIAQKNFITVDVEVFSDSYDLWKEIISGLKFDLLYLDIKLYGLNGIDIAKKIREKEIDSIIIYVSNYDNYFIQLFEVEAFRFIKKPVNEQYLLSIFSKHTKN